MARLRTFFHGLLGLVLLLIAGGAAAQESGVYSGVEWLTKDQLRGCLLLDHERVGYRPVVEDLRRKQQAASAQYMAAYDSPQGDEEAALATFQRVDAAYGEAKQRADAMRQQFAAECADRPYSQLHFNQLREELGFGWSSER